MALKRAIAIQLDAALERGELQVRKALVRRVLGVQSSLELVTTNWDLALEARFPEIEDRIIHLHGDTRKPEAVYLPSEMAREAYRTPAERHEFTKHTGLWKLLAEARNVVIYGLSMSALDAELAMFLRAGFSQSKHGCKVIIVNLKDELPILKARVSLLVPRGIEITCEDVKSEVEATSL